MTDCGMPNVTKPRDTKSSMFNGTQELNDNVIIIIIIMTQWFVQTYKTQRCWQQVQTRLTSDDEKSVKVNFQILLESYDTFATQNVWW